MSLFPNERDHARQEGFRDALAVIEQKDRAIERLRDALQNAIYAAWDGPPEPVGSGCKETYSGWRRRLENECKAVLRESTGNTP